MNLTNASILTAMVTPFNEVGELDYQQLPILIEYLLSHHTEGLVVAGTTGESPTLTETEMLALFKETVKIVNGRVPIICGVGSNSTQQTIEFIKKVAEIKGVSAGLVVVPYYNRPNQAGLYQHFKAVAEASPLPIILYNVPSRTAVNMDVATTLRLAQLPNVIGTKDCSGIEAIAHLKAQGPKDFLIYTGEDTLGFAAKTVGAQGVISVASHLLGDEMYRLYQLVEAGQLPEAGHLYRQLLPKMEAVFSVPSPAPVKAVLNHRGILVGDVRLPLVACTSVEQENILMILEQ